MSLACFLSYLECQTQFEKMGGGYKKGSRNYKNEKWRGRECSFIDNEFISLFKYIACLVNEKWNENDKTSKSILLYNFFTVELKSNRHVP